MKANSPLQFRKLTFQDDSFVTLSLANLHSFARYSISKHCVITPATSKVAFKPETHASLSEFLLQQYFQLMRWFAHSFKPTDSV